MIDSIHRWKLGFFPSKPKKIINLFVKQILFLASFCNEEGFLGYWLVHTSRCYDVLWLWICMKHSLRRHHQLLVFLRYWTVRLPNLGHSEQVFGTYIELEKIISVLQRFGWIVSAATMLRQKNLIFLNIHFLGNYTVQSWFALFQVG